MSKDYPEILTDLSTRISTRLVASGVEQQLAGEVACAVTEEMRQHWGGQLIYVPQGMSFEKRKEYERVWKAFNGHNHEHLAREFKKSISQVYRIVEFMRAEKLRESQADMFGDGPVPKKDAA